MKKMRIILSIAIMNGVSSFGDRYLFEMLVLESFHCGLSWLLILNKRNNFGAAFDGFNPSMIKYYDVGRVEELSATRELYEIKPKSERQLIILCASLRCKRNLEVSGPYRSQ